jgi:hypothetical protein
MAFGVALMAIAIKVNGQMADNKESVKEKIKITYTKAIS